MLLQVKVLKSNVPQGHTVSYSHLAEGSDQLLVHGLVAVLCEDAEQGLPLVQSLGSLPQPSSETVGNQSLNKEICTEFSEIRVCVEWIISMV